MTALSTLALHQPVCLKLPLWGGFSAPFARPNRKARYAAMHSFATRAQAAEMTLHAGIPLDPVARAMVESLLLPDSRAMPLMREGRVYAMDELADRQSPVRAELHAATGLSDMRVVRVTDG